MPTTNDTTKFDNYHVQTVNGVQYLYNVDLEGISRLVASKYEATLSDLISMATAHADGETTTWADGR